MADLILRDNYFHKTAFSDSSDPVVFLEFDCAIGYNNSTLPSSEKGKNEFTLKCRLIDGPVIPLGYYVAYGNITEYAGKISERTIDLIDKTVTYYGFSIHSGVSGRSKRFLSDSGILSASYSAKTLRYESSQIGMIIDNFQSSGGFTQRNKTTLVPNIQLTEANLGDTIYARDKEYDLIASSYLIEKYVHLRPNSEYYECTLGPIS